ncbi:hypothetical protein [Micromonospora avicenniae]|uniref:hypothetical protein n=1 Tax=Micromonospora avicenniae TaxID=1198245 RepID=UPI0033252DF4
MEYLKSRGLLWANAQFFKLGFVENPLPGHEKYRGRISIPYLTRSGAVDIRFRALPELVDGEYQKPIGAKMLSLPGNIPRLYNTLDLDRRETFICLCEGEPDTWTAHQAGLPAVGVPGIDGWSEWWARCFKGYEAVYILAHNDPLKKRNGCRPCEMNGFEECQGHNVGAEYAERIAAQIENARVVLMPPGEDVNSFVQAEGAQALIDRIGVKL